VDFLAVEILTFSNAVHSIFNNGYVFCLLFSSRLSCHRQLVLFFLSEK